MVPHGDRWERAITPAPGRRAEKQTELNSRRSNGSCGRFSHVPTSPTSGDRGRDTRKRAVGFDLPLAFSTTMLSTTLSKSASVPGSGTFDLRTRSMARLASDTGSIPAVTMRYMRAPIP